MMKNKKGQSFLVPLAAGTFIFVMVIVLAASVGQKMAESQVSCATGLTWDSSTGFCYGCTTNTSFTYDATNDWCEWDGSNTSVINVFNRNMTVAPIGYTSGENVSCPSYLTTTLQLTAATDYVANRPAGQINITKDARAVTWRNFTGINDTNVSLYNSTDKLGSFDNVTFVLFNCTDPTIVYNRSNFNLYFNNSDGVGPRIMMLSTGWIENDSIYCYNTSGSYTYGGANCLFLWQNTTTSENSTAVASLAAANALYVVGQMGSGGLSGYLPLIFIAVIAIGILTMMGMGLGRKGEY